MIRIDVDLFGTGYTQEQALVLKTEVLAWASTNGFKGTVLIAEQL